MAKRARSLANVTPKRSAHPLNPLAGDVPVPEDEREIHAALRAGRITLRVFPYFGWRYGERGRQFTRSDSAWLAWLSRHDQDAVVDKVLWLGAILANRGMRRLLLETHLGVMERQLSRAIPARRNEYRTLLAAQEVLRDARTRAVDEQAAGQMVDEFVATFGGEPRWLLRGTAMLLVSAVSDQRAGIGNATSSLREWLCDIEGLRAVAGLRAMLAEDQRRTLDDDAFAERWSAAIDTVIRHAERNER